MSLEKAISYFVLALESEQLSKHSIRAYKQDLNQFCTWTKKETLDDLDFEDFQNYFSEIASLNISSIKRKRVVLHRFLSFCYRKKMCTHKLEEYIDPIRSKKITIPKEVFTKEEISQIQLFLLQEKEKASTKRKTSYYEYLYYCAIRNEFLITFLLYTGCRAHEVVALKKKDIDLEKNTITLLTKGSKYNQIPIHEKLLKAYKEYLDECHELEEAIQIYLESSPYLFPSKLSANQYISTRTLHDVMKKLSKVIGRPIHAHLFRHTFASYCIASNMDISTISSLISHSNPSITLSIYTHEIDAHNKQEQIKKLHFDL